MGGKVTLKSKELIENRSGVEEILFQNTENISEDISCSVSSRRVRKRDLSAVLKNYALIKKFVRFKKAKH